MRISRALVLAGFFGLVATPARASTPIFSGTYTGGNHFSTVASISLSYDFVSQGIYMFTLDVTNQGQFGEVYRQIGLFNLPSAFTVESYGCPSGWTTEAANQWGAGLGESTAGCNAPLPATTYGLQPGSGTTSFQFGIGGFTSLAQVNGVGAGVYAVGADLASGCRNTRLGVQDGAAIRDGTCGPTPQVVQPLQTLLQEPTTVVPEPGSTVLLATGLLGLLGFGYVRRRRGLPMMEDAA